MVPMITVSHCAITSGSFLMYFFLFFE